MVSIVHLYLIGIFSFSLNDTYLIVFSFISKQIINEWRSNLEVSFFFFFFLLYSLIVMMESNKPFSWDRKSIFQSLFLST